MSAPLRSPALGGDIDGPAAQSPELAGLNRAAMEKKIVGMKQELKRYRLRDQEQTHEIARLTGELLADRSERKRDTTVFFRAFQKIELSERKQTNAKSILEAQHGGTPGEFQLWRDGVDNFVNGVG